MKKGKILLIPLICLGLFSALPVEHNSVNAEVAGDKLNTLIASYYHNGYYVKDTKINITAEAVNELSQNGGFHQSNVLERTTYYTPDSLWMTRGDGKYSYYGTDSEGNLTSGTANEALVDPANPVVAVRKGVNTATQTWDSEDVGMEGYYITLKDISETDASLWSVEGNVYSSTNDEVIKLFKGFTAPCYLGFATQTGNYIDLTKVEVEEVNSKLVLRLYASETDSGKLLAGSNNVFAQAEVVPSHSYNEDRTCECGKKAVLTKIGSHTGVAKWEMTSPEKLNATGAFVHNVSNVPIDDELTLQIKHTGWENNKELSYCYNIKLVDGVLSINYQLGFSPWTEDSPIVLSTEHKARLASEDGLDFVVYYDSENQKTELFIYTSHELVKLHSKNLYHKTMNNFYRITYSLSNATATVSTNVYKTYDSTIEEVYEELGLVLTEHSYINVDASEASCSTEGIAAHKECIMCGHKVGMDGNEVEVIPMSGHTYVDGVCNCGKNSPFTVHDSHIYSATGEKWDYADAYFTHVIHENFKYSSVDGQGELVDFTEEIKYVGWGNAAYAYKLLLKASSGNLSVKYGDYTVSLSEESVDLLKSESGLDLFVAFNKTTKKMQVYTITSEGVVCLIDFTCWDSKAAGYYETNLLTHNENMTLSSVIYKTSDEFEPYSDLLNL